MFLSIGNEVVLKSNPTVKMTVNKIVDSNNVGCCWFDDKNSLCYGEFPNMTLILMVERGGISESDNILLG